MPAVTNLALTPLGHLPSCELFTSRDIRISTDPVAVPSPVIPDDTPMLTLLKQKGGLKRVHYDEEANAGDRYTRGSREDD